MLSQRTRVTVSVKQNMLIQLLEDAHDVAGLNFPFATSRPRMEAHLSWLRTD